MKRGGSMPNLHIKKKVVSRGLTSRQTGASIDKFIPSVTYRDINEISKKMFMEELQRKWIRRERAEDNSPTWETPQPNRPSTRHLTSRAWLDSFPAYQDQQTINTQREYWKRIGMYDNFKRAKIDIEKGKIQQQWNKRIMTSRGVRKISELTDLSPSPSGKALRPKATLPNSKFWMNTATEYSDVLRQYILGGIKT